MSDSAPGEQFWTFSLTVYGQPEVERACLRLQFDHYLDVNVVLFCAWAGVLGISLDKATFAEHIAAAGKWQELAVQPIRGIRRRLKDLTVAGLSTEGRDELREAIKSAELQAEKLEQSVLVQTLAGLTQGDPSVALADANFDAYWRLAGQGEQAAGVQEWRIIRAAAMPSETAAPK
jgi:uncharacterized protein (TIGR02444 family)